MMRPLHTHSHEREFFAPSTWFKGNGKFYICQVGGAQTCCEDDCVNFSLIFLDEKTEKHAKDGEGGRESRGQAKFIVRRTMPHFVYIFFYDTPELLCWAARCFWNFWFAFFSPLSSHSFQSLFSRVENHFFPLSPLFLPFFTRHWTITSSLATAAAQLTKHRIGIVSATASALLWVAFIKSSDLCLLSTPSLLMERLHSIDWPKLFLVFEVSDYHS